MTPADILDFWFSEPSRRRWFKSTSGFDRELAERFEELHVSRALTARSRW
jgi:uncharacterized protein (DUF924 family)